MSDVFISYSRENQELVRRLAEAVQRLGYDVWWDAQLPPHLSYGEVIAQKVGAAKAAIVVWSANAADSEWVRAEADMARNQKKLIQTSLDDREPPMPFNQLHYVSLADWDGAEDHPGWSKVKESLTALCGPPGAPTATVAPIVTTAVTAAPVPAPPPAPTQQTYPPVTAAPRAGRGSNKLLMILIGVSVLVIAAVAILALTRGRSPAPAGNQAAAQAPAAGELNQEAVIRDPSGHANVRREPSADAAVVARLNDGETFNTHEQDAEWWQVRIAGGLTGYMQRSQIRLREPVGVPNLAGPAPTTTTTTTTGTVAPPPPLIPTQQPPQQRTQTRTQTQRPVRPAGPRLNQDNAGIARDYCMGAGMGTPVCRRLGLGGRRMMEPDGRGRFRRGRAD